jgi:hypothetical protein
MKLSLANQPAGGASIADSDPFYFVFYKGVPQSLALSAAQSAFPGASIQAVPEPAATACGFALFAVLTLHRRRCRAAGRIA